MFKHIKAKSGCVIFFPSRKDSKRLPSIIYGSIKTKKKWREEWLQVKIAEISIEIRLEGDNSINLGNELTCDVIAKLRTQIDDTNLEYSIPKVAESFLCSTTSNIDYVIDENFFKEKIQTKFRGIVHQVAKKASYRKLLEDPSHRKELESQFENNVASMITNRGFALIACEIRFNPQDPGISGSEKDISTMWMEWEKERLRLESEKERMKKDIEEEAKRHEALRKEGTEKLFKEIEVREKEFEKEYLKQLQKIEIEAEESKNEKEFQISEKRKELEIFFNKRQEEKEEYQRKLEKEKEEHLHQVDMKKLENEQQIEAYKYEIEIKKVENREKLLKLEQDEKLQREKTQLEHEEELLDRKVAKINKEKEIAKHQYEIFEIKSNAKKYSGAIEVELMKSRIEAKNIVNVEYFKSQAEIFNQLFKSMPEIISKMPVEKIGETTLINFGKDINGDMSKMGLPALGLAFLPIIKEIVSILPEKIKGHFIDESSLDKKESHEKQSTEMIEKNKTANPSLLVPNDTESLEFR